MRPASQQRRGGGHAAAGPRAVRGTIALARLGPIIPLLRPNRQLVRPPSSEGQHKCERSEALVGGDRRRTARATTADYLLWRAKGTALSLPPDDGQSLWTIALAPPATRNIQRQNAPATEARASERRSAPCHYERGGPPRVLWSSSDRDVPRIGKRRPSLCILSIGQL